MSDEKVVDFPQKRFAEDMDDVINMHMKDGALNLHELDNTPTIATNGGLKCDVIDGPCGCGAWHSRGEGGRKWTPEYLAYCRMHDKEPGE